MSNEIIILVGAAAAVGFVHTVFGPDHYLPFIVLSKARQWSIVKTVMVTFLCGLGHVLSSVALGFIGIALGIAVFKLEAIESFRGELAAWILIAFGFTYFVWGIHRAIRNRPHTHIHTSKSGSLTPWILFTIFIFGPCEPLIPLVMYPAAKGDMMTVVIVAFVFGLTTISTMLGIVLASSYGLAKLPFGKLGKYSHALAGLVILLCGGAIKFLGL
jgi:sulfite exporter TauE/SafE